MTIKRCNHCQLIDGQAIELSVSKAATCPNCGCIWLVNGYHQLAGKVNGKECAYPQPQ